MGRGEGGARVQAGRRVRRRNTDVQPARRVLLIDGPKAPRVATQPVAKRCGVRRRGEAESACRLARGDMRPHWRRRTLTDKNEEGEDQEGEAEPQGEQRVRLVDKHEGDLRVAEAAAVEVCPAARARAPSVSISFVHAGGHRTPCGTRRGTARHLARARPEWTG